MFVYIDVNGDGIRDKSVYFDDGSSLVMQFGSFNANGEWISSSSIPEGTKLKFDNCVSRPSRFYSIYDCSKGSKSIGLGAYNAESSDEGGSGATSTVDIGSIEE